MTTFARAQSRRSSAALVQPRYRPDIDGLRAVAVICVIIFHAAPDWLPGGFVGVDVFFVISGFLISTIILTNLQLGTFRFTEFYGRRIRRIFPALLLVMSAVLGAGWLVLLPSEYELLGKHVASGAGFVSNLALWRESGYFDVDASTKPLLHLWSLGIEEQFYIFFPVALCAAWRWGLNLLTLTLVGLGASLMLNLLLVNSHSAAAFYIPATRAWELLFGALLAHLAFEGRLEQFGKSSHLSRNALAVSGTLLIGIGLVFLDSHQAFPGWRAIIPAAGAVLLVGAGPTAWINRHVLSNQLLVGIGLISFPLYLWHWPLLTFPRIMFGSISVSSALAAVAAAIALSAATYLLVEKRTRRAGNGVVAVLLTAMLACGAAGAACFISNGAPQRPNFAHATAVQQQLVGPTWRYTTNEECKSRYRGLEYRYFCSLSRDDNPTLLLMGDSFANALYGGIVRHPELAHHVVLSFGSCSPGSSVTKPGDCATLKRIIETTPSIRYAFVTAYWPRFDAAGNSVDLVTGKAVESPSSAGDYARALDQRISFLEARGIKVVVFGPKPELGYEPSLCFARPFSSPAKQCVLDRESADGQEKSITLIIQAVLAKHPAVLYFDQNELFCPVGSACSIIKDGMPLLRDFRHYSEFGSDEIIKKFVTWVAPLSPSLLRQ